MQRRDSIELKKRFGAHLQKLREEKGYSLRKLAQHCDIDDSNISKIEQGKFNITLATIFELANGLGVEPTALIDFK